MGKRLLYIGTPIFGFNDHIISELELRGFTVDYFNDRPSENSFVKGTLKIKPSLLENYSEKYFQSILNHCEKIDYDVVFVINGKIFDKDMIKRLKANQKNAKFIYYTWDSVANYPNSVDIAEVFDESYTFDLLDSKKYEVLKFLPLFYSNGFKKIGNISKKYEYDILSVCTAHPNRYKTIVKYFPTLKQQNIKIFSFLYINKLQYYYNKFKISDFRKAKKKEFSFTTMSEEEYLLKLKKAKAVFDVEHSKQSGLTIRTIETLGAKRKLITTNTTINTYDFYNEDNILILQNDDQDIRRIIDFLEKPYKEIDPDVYNSYSLSVWVAKLVG